jgi:hypothetical protein
VANEVEVKITAKDDTASGYAGAEGRTKAFEAAITRSYASQARAAKLLRDTEKVLGDETDTTTQKTGKLSQAFSALGGLGGAGGTSAMGGAIAAGVALAPVVTSIGVGLGGLGIAAYGAAKPILAASQATGGLQANMSKLDPEQRKVAQGILGLQSNYDKFQKALAPQVLGIFNNGLRIAGGLLKDIQPVTKATGSGLNSMLSSVDQVFRSGTWQQFFGFMAKTAGPDMRQLTSIFAGLLRALPPLLEALQPLSQAFLTIGIQAARAAGPVGNLLKTMSDNIQASSHNANQAAKGVDSWVVAWTNRWIPGAKTVNRLLSDGQRGAENMGKAVRTSGGDAATAAPKVWSLNSAVGTLNGSMTTLVGNLLTLQGSNVSWKQSMHAAEAQLKSNNAGLEGNSSKALANKAAVIQSSNAAITFAQNQLTLGKNIGGATRTVKDQIGFLQGLHDKSKFVKDEIEALQDEEQKLQAQKMNQRLSVHGDGSWSIAGVTGKTTVAPRTGAAGGLLSGGVPGKDSIPLMAMPGELIVPTGMVNAGAVDHLRGKLPGFASGGIVPSYSGGVGGMSPWIKHNDQATIHLIDQAVAKATAAGIRSAQFASSFVGNVGSGVNRWRGTVMQALGMEGLSPMLLGRVLFQMQTESGGNPNAINLTDSNAAAGDPSRGLMQTIGSTFRAYHWPGTSMNIYNPLANIAAALNYARHVYGPSLMSGGMGIGSGHGYDTGGWLPTGRSIAINNTGRPERVLGPNESQRIVLDVQGDGQIAECLRMVLRNHVRTRYGGNVTAALGG